MIKVLPLVISFSLITTIINAQTNFQKNYGGNVLDWANSIVQTTDSGFILLGTSRNFGAGLEDLFVIKTDLHGDTLWTRTFGGSDKDEGAEVQQTAEGGYIFSGSTVSFGGSSEIYLVKTNENGDTAWSRNYGGNGFEYCKGVKQCFDGGYLLNGFTGSFVVGGHTDMYLIKTDASGDTMWTKTLGTPGVGDTCFSAIQTNDSGFVLTGTGVINGSSDLYLIKTDVSGTVLWSKTYGGSGAEAGFSIIQTTDGGYCVTGTTTSFGAGAKDIYVIKTDANGDTLWARTYGGAGSEEGNSIKQTADGGFIMTGYTNSFSAGDDLFIIKTDVWGFIEWLKLVGAVSNAKDEGRCVITTLDGGYAIAGFTQSNGNGTDVIFIKTDSTGSYGCGQSNFSFVVSSPVSTLATPSLAIGFGASVNHPTTIQNFGPSDVNLICTPVSVSENSPEVNNNIIMVYPNPFSSTAILKIESVQSIGSLLFTLTDVEGRVVSTQQINNHNKTYSIAANGLQPGMYFYQVNTADSKQLIGSGKVVIE